MSCKLSSYNKTNKITQINVYVNVCLDIIIYDTKNGKRIASREVNILTNTTCDESS